MKFVFRFLIAAAALTSIVAEAATCTSNAAGNWNAAATWTNCANNIPQDGDAVVINHAVTLNVSTNDLASLTINLGGSLSLSGTTTYDIYLGGNLTNHGLIDFQSSSGTNTIYLSGSNVTSTFSGAGTWLLDNLDLNGAAGHACTGTCKIELSGSPHLKFSNGSLFSDNSSTKLFNAGGNATAIVELNRAGSQSIQTAGVTYPNLVTSGSGTKTPSSGTLTILGSLTVSSGTTFDANNNDPTVNLGGNLTLSGSLSSGSNTWTFNGSSAQSILAGTPTFQRLAVNNAAGLTLASGNVTVTTALTYTAGRITTGSHALVYSGTCPSSARGSASSHVFGNLRLTVASGSSTCFFDVGDATGYAPVTTAFTGATSGTLTARADAGDHTDTGSGLSGIDGTKSANHTWTLTAGTLASYTSYSATFRYCASTGSCTATEVDSGAATGTFVVAQKFGGSWSSPTAGTRTAYSTQATGLTSLGEFAVGEPAAVLCFTDSFSRSDGTPGSNWSVGAYGSYTPAIAGNRLRLTDAGTNLGTWATLQRYFPAAGNKITIDFDHYAYGGTGADGIAVILSNAGVAPTVGAFGGSLGYAPKSEQDSDCTNPGGCPGFTGGWLGVAIDEFGNFQNPTEGRIGGSVNGQVPDSVSVRGSGSGMSGYRYLTGSTTLSPGVDGSFSPAHHYRIVVDHSDSVHAYVTVERDTAWGTQNSNYVTVIPRFDAKDLAYSQDAVPANWQLSFTGSNGASTNIHEIDALQVCTVTGIATPTLHHIRLEHGGSACRGSSNPASVTVKACANDACTSLYLGSVTVNLSDIAGTTWSSDPVTFSGGQTTVTLARNNAGSVTLGTSATNPTTSNATRCFNGTTQTCTLTYAACYLDAVESGAAAYTPIYTKIAGKDFTLTVRNVSGGWQTVSKVEIVNAGVGSDCAAHTSLSSTPVNWTLSSSQTQNIAFNYADAVRNARIRMTSGSGTSCSTDNFAIRPAYFVLSSTANGTTALKAASDTFSITATAANAAGATTSSYDGTPAFDLTTTDAIKGTSGTSDAPVNGTLGAAVFGATSGGVATAAGLSYSEVGNIVFAANAVNDDAFAAVDSDKTSPECTSNFNYGDPANGMYGCMIGAAALTVGRFIPHHFSTTLTHGCAAGSFTYSRQPFDAKVTAYNGVGGVTKNYAGTQARAVTLSDGGSGAVPCTSNCTVAAEKFTFGIATLDAAASLQPTFAFANVLTAPAALALRATESAGGDGVTSAGTTEGTTALRSGRLRLSNAFGSEKSPLAMAVQAQYWSGNSWVINSSDTCTTIPGNAFALSSGITSVSGIVATSGGNFTLTLNAPGAKIVGSVDIAANLGATNQDQSCLASHPASTGANLPWLRSRNGSKYPDGTACPQTYDRDPSARATFGIYSPESRRTVHVRESF